jgi:hypothetical protein
MNRCIFDIPAHVLHSIDTEWSTITLRKVRELVDGSKPLEDMNIRELKELGQRFKVKNWSRLPKDQLILELWHLHTSKLNVEDLDVCFEESSAVKRILVQSDIEIVEWDVSFIIDVHRKDMAKIFFDIISLARMSSLTSNAEKRIVGKARLLHHRYPSNFVFNYATKNKS